MALSAGDDGSVNNGMSPEVIQQRLLRGQEYANLEFKSLEHAPTVEMVNIVSQMDQENAEMECKVNKAMVRELKVAEEGIATEAQQHQFLQTKTIALSEVRKNLKDWVPSMRSEIESFETNQAVQRVSQREADKLMEEARSAGKKVETIPAMGVFTRKAGSGKYKSRIVACGNFMADRATEELYASGVDATQVRALLRKASLEGWSAMTLDIKTAFLLAPTSQDELIVVRPPKILQEAGLTATDEVWVVTGAMYGLTTAPRDWGLHRDATVKDLEWTHVTEQGRKVKLGFKQLDDANLWAVTEIVGRGSEGERLWGTYLGFAAFYVDDMLVVGPRGITEEAATTIRKVWNTSDPEWAEVGGKPMKFLGMEIQRLEDGAYYIHQGCYAREILSRSEVESACAFVKVPDEREEPVEVHLAQVRRAQKLTGELLWLSGRTRPDISAGVLKMSQKAMKDPTWTLELGMNILKYVNGTKDYGLHYPVGVVEDSDPDLMRKTRRSKNTMEVLVDASFAPEDQHSISGLVVLYAGSPIQWDSHKQTLIALSTAEAELNALLEGLAAGRSVRSLLYQLQPIVDFDLFNDNRAAIILAGGQGGGWRTRHLRIRANCLAEAIKEKEVDLSHRSGTKLWADSLTKCLPTQSLERFCNGIDLVPAGVKMLEEHQVDSPGIQRMIKALNLVQIGKKCMDGLEDTNLTEDPCEPYGGGEVIMLTGVAVVYHMVATLGMAVVRRIWTRQDDLKVKILDAHAEAPVRGSDHAAGYDLVTCRDFVVEPGESVLVPTGIALQIPRGHYGRIAARSSLAVRGVDIGGGVIDADYRGEVKVVLYNRGSEVLNFKTGERIAQLILERISQPPVTVVGELPGTARGSGGFGSTDTYTPGGRDITRAEARSRLGRILDWIRIHGTTQAGENSDRRVQSLSLQSLGLSDSVAAARPSSSSSATVRRSRPRVRTVRTMPKPKAETGSGTPEPEPEAAVVAPKAESVPEVSTEVAPPEAPTESAEPPTESAEVSTPAVKKKAMPERPPKPVLRKAAKNPLPVDLTRFSREARGEEPREEPAPKRSIFYIEDQLLQRGDQNLWNAPWRQNVPDSQWGPGETVDLEGGDYGPTSGPPKKEPAVPVGYRAPLPRVPSKKKGYLKEDAPLEEMDPQASSSKSMQISSKEKLLAELEEVREKVISRAHDAGLGTRAMLVQAFDLSMRDWFKKDSGDVQDRDVFLFRSTMQHLLVLRRAERQADDEGRARHGLDLVNLSKNVVEAVQKVAKDSLESKDKASVKVVTSRQVKAVESILATHLATDLSKYVEADAEASEAADQFLAKFVKDYKEEIGDQGQRNWRSWLDEGEESSGEDKTIPPPSRIVLKEAPQASRGDATGNDEKPAEIEEPVNTEVDPEEMLRDYALSQLSRMVAAGEVDDDLAASLRDVDPRIILEMSRKHG